MDTFAVPIEVERPADGCFERLDLQVNKSFFNIILPSSTLRELGIEPECTRPFELDDGSIREFGVSHIRIRLEGSTATSPVVFGDEDTVPTLGRYALAGLLLDVDTERSCLIPVTLRLCDHPHPVHRC